MVVFLSSFLGFVLNISASSISGFVVNSQYLPIPDLHVIITNHGQGDVTDGNGYFEFRNIPAGTYSLKFDHIGFRSETISEVQLKENQHLDLGSIKLQATVLQLGDLVVTASRSARERMEVPRPMNVVSAARITERDAKTSAEALREETGIFVQKTNHGGGSAIIRGFSSNQILLLVDGIRLNNSTYRLGNHQYLTTVDQNMIEQIEVVRGPTSVLYGSDALGGTINLITTQIAPLEESVGWQTGYRFLGRYASADNERTTRSEISVRNHSLALQTGFSIKDFDDLRRGKNSSHPSLENSTNRLKQSPSGYKAYDFDSRLVYHPNPQQSVILAYQHSRQVDVPRYDKYENNNYYRWIYQPQNRDLLYLIYQNQSPLKFITSWRAAISLHQQEEGREIQKESVSALTKELDKVRTLGFTIQGNSVFNQHIFTVGSDIYVDNVNSSRMFMEPAGGEKNNDVRGRYPDGAKYTSIGLFAQDEMHLHNRFTLTAGLRYSFFTTNFEIPYDSLAVINLGVVEQDFQSLTGSLGAIYRINDHISLNGNLGQAFRAPNLSDITKLGESKGEIFEVPNSSLEPEKIISGDFGIRMNSDKLSAEAFAYYTHISDLIASVGALYSGSPFLEMEGIIYKIKSKMNVGKAYIRGLECALNYSIHKKLMFRSSFTATYGQNTSLAEPVGGIPPIFGLAGMRWTDSAYHVEFYARFAGKQDRLSDDDADDPRIPVNGTPGWYTLNIRAGLSIDKGINMHIALENLLDYNYREHGSGINSPGRNFIISLEIID